MRINKCNKCLIYKNKTSFSVSRMFRKKIQDSFHEFEFETFREIKSKKVWWPHTYMHSDKYCIQ